MTTDEYISTLRKEHNIIINVDNNELKIRGAQKSLTSEIIDEIRTRKSEILTFFRSVRENDTSTRIPRAENREYYRLSSVQKRLYFLHQLDKTSLAYNIPRVDVLKGRLDKDRLSHTFNKLFGRHEILRTRFEEVDGIVFQRSSEQGFREIEIYPSSAEGTEEIIQKFIRPFDLARGHLMRIGLIEISPDEHFLLTDMHHIIADGFSQGVLTKEFISLYNEDDLAYPELQFRDYAEWQYDEEQVGRMHKQRDFWIAQFEDEVPPLYLPTDFPRPATKDHKGEEIAFGIDPENAAKLKAIAEAQGSTLFMILLAIYNILLGRMGDQEDIVTGIPVAGRRYAELENMIGMFVNTLPLRNYPKGERTFREFLAAVRQNVLASFDNQDFQYEDLINELNVPRDNSRNPLFDVMFIFENYDVAELRIPGLTLHPGKWKLPVSKFDLTLKAREAQGAILLSMEYSTSLFKKELIERFISWLKTIISAIVINPDVRIADIGIIREEEKRQVLQTFNDTATTNQEQTVLSLFARQVLKTPDNRAIRWENKEMSYGDLDKMSDRIAAFLQQSEGVRKGDLVGLLLARGEYLIPVILGVLKAGAAYIPIDPEYPRSRIDTIVSDACPRVLITQKKYLSNLTNCTSAVINLDEVSGVINAMSGIMSPVDVQPSSLAYVIYTSGSTGRPKGVMIEHHSLANILQRLEFAYPLNEDDSYLLKTTYCFDVSCAEIFGWFANGGSLTLLKEAAEADPKEILDTIQKEKITHINFVPSMFAVLVDELEHSGTQRIGSLKYIFLAGEALPVRLMKRFQALNTGIPLMNLYGPTEGTVYTTGCNTKTIVSGMTTVPIGKPFGNIRVYILDRHLAVQPVGIPGELYIGGEGVARGYLGQEELTLQRFITPPFKPEERIYRTGDRARWLPDGSVEYLGRADTQVKLRGYRIEMGEIESRLEAHDHIETAIVEIKEKDGNKFLVAYYVAGNELAIPPLRKFLLEKLPDYMIPACYIRLDRLPVTSNGKLDRRGLPDPIVSPGGEQIAPRTMEETLLAEVWSRVLGVENIGITDNFFSAGGDSIKSIQICSRMRSAGYELFVKDIFSNQTIMELAPLLKRMNSVTDQASVVGRAALTPIQRWFFEGPVKNKHYFTQSVLLNFTEAVARESVKSIFEKIQDHHDALRMIFTEDDGTVIQENKGPGMPVFIVESDLRGEEDAASTLLSLGSELHAGIDLTSGPLMRLGLFHLKDGSRLLIVIHHLVVDGISWRILFEDIESLYHQVKGVGPLSLPLKTAPFLSWSPCLKKYAESKAFEDEKTYWQSVAAKQSRPIPRDYDAKDNITGDYRAAEFQLSEEDTVRLLKQAPSAFNTHMNDILLTALLLAVRKKYGYDALKIDLESHGRADIDPEINIQRTVGWFTSIYPVLLEYGAGLKSTIKQVKEVLRKVPHRGIGYLLAGNRQHSRIIFNYLGQFDSDVKNASYTIANERKGDEIGADEPAMHDWNISGMVINGQLNMTVSYSVQQYDPATIARFMDCYKDSLLEVIGCCCSYGRKELTPSDLTYWGLSVEELDALQEDYAMENVCLLSPMQEGILFHTSTDTDAVSYSIQTTCQLIGDLDILAIEGSVNHLMLRYDILRTVFLHEGYDRPIQVVLRERKIPFVYEDIRAACLPGRKAEVVRSRQMAERLRRFDPAKDVLMRLVMLRTGEREYEFIWNHHHMLMDGWCMSILVNEFTVIYSKLMRGEAIRLAAVRPYSDYIEWLGNRDQEGALGYWRQYLSAYDSLATLPGREKASPGREKASGGGRGYEQRTREFAMGEEVMDGLRRVSRQYGVTINTIIQGAWGLLLARYNNVDDVVFGSVVSGRPAELDGVEEMVGLFINTIPVRVRYREEETAGGFLQRLQAEALESEPYHYHSLSEIQSLSELEEGLLDHIMAFENFPVAQQLETPRGQEGTGDRPFEIRNAGFFVQTNYDLNITVLPMDDLVVRFDFNVNKYEDAMIGRVGAQLHNIISSIAESPEQQLKGISLYNAEERSDLGRWLTVDLEAGTQEGTIRGETIQEQLRRSFARHGERCALEYRKKSYTYGQIGEQAGKVARSLSGHGAEEGSYVGILCEDRQWLISSIVGVLQSRMAFVVLETTLPAARLSSMISQVNMDYIITDQGAAIREKLDPAGRLDWVRVEEIGQERGSDLAVNPAYAGNPDYPVNPAYAPEDRVYVYFTSGSTGNPKGVAGRNKGLAHFIAWEIKTFGIDESFRCSQFTNPGFDVFMRDIFVPLCSGGTICVPDEESLSSGARISRWIDSQRIGLIHCVPSFFKLFGREGLRSTQFAALRYLLLAGEKILPYELQEWFQAFGERIRLVNIYGPTETTLAKGYYLINADDSRRKYIPVRAMAGAQFLVLDKRLGVCPAGATGEIYIRTPYRSAGYLDPAATQKAFIVNPYNEDQHDWLYRTGDLGREVEDGGIEILGRTDHQVKIRGIRIELDDIRENMLKYPGVTDGVVITKEDKGGEKYICAYIVANKPIAQAALREFLELHLPATMIPQHLVWLSKLPLLANGKIDRRSLPEPEVDRAEEHVAPINEVEDKLADIWSEVLKLDKDLISTNKSFIELGGHSLKLLLLINKIQQAFGVKLKLGEIYRHNSIGQMAGLIESGKEQNSTGIPRLDEMERYPTSPAQKRLYYHYLLNKDSVLFNIPIAIRIQTEIDPDRIQQCFRQLISRHPALRTSFILTGEDVFQVINDIVDLELEIIDTNKYGSPEEAFEDFIRPFDLSMPSLLRCGIYAGKTGGLLFVDVHHIVADGISINILAGDFRKLYLGETLPVLPIRYVDYAGWINDLKGKLQSQQDYWSRQLSGELPSSAISAIRTWQEGKNHVAMEKVLEISGPLYEDIRAFTSSTATTDFVFLISACFILLSRLSGKSDIIIGTDVAGRTQIALQDIVGTFVNVLPLRLHVDPESSYMYHLESVRRLVLEGFENQDFQFDQMVSMVRRGEDAAPPLVDFHFSIANTGDDKVELEAFDFFPLKSRYDKLADYELQLIAREEDGSMYITFSYNNERYSEDMIDWMMTYYLSIVKKIIEDRHVKIWKIELTNEVTP